MNRTTVAVGLIVALAGAAQAQQGGALPRGLFGEDAKDCQAAENGDENGARSISKDGKTLESFASQCSIRSVARNGATFKLNATCRGEGETWNEPIEIVVVNKDTLRWSERGDARTLKRC